MLTILLLSAVIGYITAHFLYESLKRRRKKDIIYIIVLILAIMGMAIMLTMVDI